jgi:hypothetical protein
MYENKYSSLMSDPVIYIYNQPTIIHMKIYLQLQLQLSLTGDRAARRRLIDPVVNKSSSDESLKTVMEICMRCLSKEPLQRPSVEDVLWNLQFAAQVLARSCEASPMTPSRPRRS